VGRLPAEVDLDLAHLQAELARIDAVIRRQVRQWQLAGQDLGDAFRGLYTTHEQAEALLAQPLGGNWGALADLPPEEEHTFDQAEAAARAAACAVAERAGREGHSLRLDHLCERFQLGHFERDALLICLAPALDLRYERLYGYLQDDVTRKRPSANLVLDLLVEPGLGRLRYLRYLAEDAPLFAHRLLQRLAGPGGDPLSPLSQMIGPDETVVAWLLGRYVPVSSLSAQVAFTTPQETSYDRLAAGSGAVAALEEWSLSAGEQVPPILAFSGPDRSAQQAAARLCAASLGKPLLEVEIVARSEEGAYPAELLAIALRDAQLTQAVLLLAGWHGYLQDGSTAAALVPALLAHPGPAILTGSEQWQPSNGGRERAIRWIEFPVPSFDERLALWQHLASGDAVGAEDLGLAALAGQFALTSGTIRDAFATARDQAAQDGRPLAEQDLYSSARTYSNPRLSGLARKILPRYSWEDIVLPGDQMALLREIVDTVRGRPLVLGEWGIGAKLASSAGVTVLFAGPPGTGKTMAAEVIAGELGLDLYKIDLSTVVSKYIGETEKNLERIFEEAQTSNAILFFDEADAIFGKRSEVKDAHDRYANLEISYLLQRMEIYDGVAVLATNLRANLDEAFTRRLQFSVHFPFPEEVYRLRIWQTLFPPGVPRDADVDFDLLARRFRLSGGSIRNIIVSAAYLAAANGRAVSMDHLLHGTRRELQKMGRLVNEADMAAE
jgi:hypothetical protein